MLIDDEGDVYAIKLKANEKDSILALRRVIGKLSMKVTSSL